MVSISLVVPLCTALFPITSRESVTGPTVPQQKTVERFSHLGRVEAVVVQQKSVDSILLNGSVWMRISSYVVVQILLYHSSNI